MINIIYIYPNTNFINNEINILRIVDEKIKESLIIFGIKEDNNLNIYITNTMTGDNKLVKIFDDINEFVEIIKSKESEIKALKDLMEIEKYILNVIG